MAIPGVPILGHFPCADGFDFSQKDSDGRGVKIDEIQLMHKTCTKHGQGQNKSYQSSVFRGTLDYQSSRLAWSETQLKRRLIASWDGGF
jgi:hypothetical protein